MNAPLKPLDGFLVVSVEQALAAIRSMAHNTHPRVRALMLGTEDFATDLGCTPGSPAIAAAFHELGVSAKSLDLELFGFPASIAEFTKLEEFKSGVQMGRDAGAVGAFCIHPAQVAILNEVFSPSAEQLEWASKVISAYEKAKQENSGTSVLEGQMIDLPVYRRALNILSR